MHTKSSKNGFIKPFVFIAIVIMVAMAGFCTAKESSLQDSKQSASIKSGKNLAAATDTLPAFGGTSDSSNRQLIVYYFMSTYRCPSCMYIEKTTESVVKDLFAEKVKSGRVAFKAINIDEPENKHYDQDYKLYAQSVILSDVVDGKETRWTNLDKVWKLLNNDRGFKEYVTKEIKNYLGE